jgi:hypothetical protein
MTRTVGKYGLRPTPLGLKWALQFGAYVDLKALPPIPKGAFGHMTAVTKPWDIYMNDQLGCCVVSGSQHNIRLWVAEGAGSDTVVFDDKSTVSNYMLMGGYVPGDPDTDGGCDMVKAAEMWMKHGVIDANRNVHKIGAALQLDCGPGYLNLDQLWYADYLFDGIGLGIGVTQEWEDDFAAGKPWDAADYNPRNIMGGHFVPLYARETSGGTMFGEIVTWGEPQSITESGLQICTNTVMVYATQEKLHNGKDMEGLGWSDLRSDIRKVVSGRGLLAAHRL